jgi:hypothetical protein
MLARSPARQQFLETLASAHRDRDLENILAGYQRPQLSREAYQTMSRQFLTGEDMTPRTFNDLRFDGSGEVVRNVSEILANDASADVCNRALRLLAGFQSRQRTGVVRCVIQHWKALSGHSRQQACNIFTQAILRERLKEEVIGFLDRILHDGDDSVVRRTLDQVLGME